MNDLGAKILRLAENIVGQILEEVLFSEQPLEVKNGLVWLSIHVRTQVADYVADTDDSFVPVG